MTRGLTMAFLLPCLAATAWAQGGRFWRDPRMTKELGLKPAQIEELERLHQRDRDRMIDLRAAVEKKQLAVEDTMEAEPFDEAAARTAQAAVETALTELHRAEAAMRISVRKVLTLEQFKKLHGLRPPHPPRPPHGPGGPRGPMPPGPPGGPMGGPMGGPPEPPAAPEPPEPPPAR